MKKKLAKLIVFLMIVSCNSNDNIETYETINKFKKDNSTTIQRMPIACQEITIGISFPITIETTVYYCCVSELCYDPGLNPACVCGIISQDTYDDLVRVGPNNNNNNDLLMTKIHYESFLNIDKFNLGKIPDKLTVSHSSVFVIEGLKFRIKPKDYYIDKEGYLNFEIEYENRTY